MKVCSPCWFQDLKATIARFISVVGQDGESWMWAWCDAMGIDAFGMMFYKRCRCVLKNCECGDDQTEPSRKCKVHNGA